MGLFSSIKKAVSGAFKGIKKVVKKVAKGVKKVAKGIVTSTPLGHKLWKEGGKLGKKIMKGVGKFMGKLGPIGSMALSFVLAPVMGPALGALWSSFGAGAASMAASANTLMATLGTVGKGIFAAGNFVGGTLGALGNAVTEGAKNVMAGNFSQAATSFATNISNALTGKAGMASVNAGAAQAAMDAGQLLRTPEQMTSFTNDVIDPTGQTFEPIDMRADMTQGFTNDYSMETAADMALYGKPSDALTLADQQAFMKYGSEGVKAINSSASTPSVGEQVSEVASRAKEAFDFMGGSEEEEGYNPYVPRPINSVGSSRVGQNLGQGSSGFSLLGGVQGLEDSVRNSQRLMFG